MREFHKKSKIGIRCWQIWVHKDEVHSQSGALGGKMTHTYDIPGSVGKKGTKAYVSPEAQAILVSERKIKKKVEKGYYEVDPETGEAKGSSASELDFVSLPKNLAFFKPQRWPTTKKGLKVLTDVLESGRETLTIKRDGMMHAVLITVDGEVKIYTRRMDECTGSYPHLVQAFKAMDLPPESILACEFVVPAKKGDDRDKMASIGRSLPERAAKLQQVGAKAEAVILSAPFWRGHPQFNESVDNMMELLENIYFANIKGKPHAAYVSIMEIFYGTFEEAKEHCRKNELEGLVIYNGDEVFGEKAYNFRGEPERPNCWKWKPEYEDDFVVCWSPDHGDGSWGKGRLKNLPGKVALWQYDKKGKAHFICNCGSGFTDEQRQEVMDRAKKNGRAGVAIVKYIGRGFKREGHKSNALREPIFVGWHPDKTYREAVNKRL